jgi:hypothetical protein
MQDKKTKHEEMMAKVGDQHMFETLVSKWRKILTIVMNASCSTHVRNGLACNNKWSMITSDFKNNLNSWWALDKIKKTRP